MANKNIILIEDHDEALKSWREKKIKNLDLVHIDAHIDFGFYPAKPPQKLLDEAKSVKDLKRRLEYALNFLHYQKDFNKQLNIGNYIYPGMEEGIVKDFYWVVPGGLKEFRESAKSIRNILKGILRQDSILGNTPHAARRTFKKGIISVRLLGRNFTICILEKLPILKEDVLLDIDTDFLIIDSLVNTDNTKNIGKRKPWILPQDLVNSLKEKIKKPQIITVAYSVNGGYTPIIFKHLGDEIAYHYAPKKLKRRFKNNSNAAYYFNLFCSTHKKEYYQKAVRLNPAYRVADNNYGPLYLSLRKFSLAQKEFKMILRVDKNNAGALLGLGEISLQRRYFKKAKIYFSSSLTSGSRRLFTPLERARYKSSSFLTGFTKVKEQSLFGLARAEFCLKNFKKAKGLLIRYQAIEPLQAQSYYLLGYILEKEKDFVRSAKFYQDAIRLGFGGIEAISRLLKISYHLEEKNDIIKFIAAKYKEFKKRFLRTKRLSLKKRSKIKSLHRIKKRMAVLERRLQKIISVMKKGKI